MCQTEQEPSSLTSCDHSLIFDLLASRAGCSTVKLARLMVSVGMAERRHSDKF